MTIRQSVRRNRPSRQALAARVLVSGLLAAPALAGPITISSLPAVSSPVVVADDTTVYTVTLTASATAGYNDITSVRTLFNMTEANGDTSTGRGCLAWGKTDSDITNYGGTWVFADATGGGRWAYRTDTWGGDTYMTPLSCETTTAGNATGGTGTRTVTFSFRARPAWANNPLLSDADAWAMTANDGPNDSDYCKVGWKDGTAGFVVVPAPCTQEATTPNAPIVSNPTAGTLDVAVNPADSDTDVFAIRISPPTDSTANVNMFNEYVQADGTIDGQPVWQTKAAWATTTVQGLIAGVNYSFTVCATNSTPGTCPSSWSPPAGATTTILSRTIDCAAPGTAISRALAGINIHIWSYGGQNMENNWLAAFNTSIRSGGDGYDWKTLTAQWGSGSSTMLDWLRKTRDHNSCIQMLTNTRGIGTGNGATWVYTDQTPETCAALAADFVSYCNILLQTRRQGDTLTPQEQALLDSMQWGTADKLLAPGEAAVPPVTWWEIGNEPEGPYPPPALTPEDYAVRYKASAIAMIARDPTIKIGPGCMTANNGNAWLDAVFSDPTNRVDLVAYHPYGNLYGITRDNTGGTLDAPYLMRGLNLQKSAQASAKQKIVERLVAADRPADTPLLISEWNPSSWQGTYYYYLSQTVAHGLGVADDIFTFGELGVTAAQYWDQPNYRSVYPVELPGFKVFKALQTLLPDRLIDSGSDGTFRLYTTRDSTYQSLILWAINMSETDDKTVRIYLQNLPPPVTVASITKKKLGAYSGETSLAMKNYTTEIVGWTDTDLTGRIDLTDFTMTFDNATLTLLIFDLDLITDAPIVLDPTHFEHTLYVGTALGDDTFTVATGGPDTLHYTVASDAPWLTVWPESGTRPSGGTDPIALQYDVAGLPPGEYSATVSVASNDAYNSPQTVTVHLTVQTGGRDYDLDGDIDMADFGHFQACLTGPGVPQNNSACAGTKLDPDADVDEDDLALFLPCLSGASVPPAVNCLQ